MRLIGAVALALAAIFLAGPARTEVVLDVPAGPQPRAVLERLIAELPTHCPLADPADRAALETCRAGLAGSPGLKELFRGRVDWGRGMAGTPFWRLRTETVESGDLLGHYLPLLMFDGTFRAERKRNEAWVVLYMTVRPRSLDLTGLPSPPWPDRTAREALQDARELVLAVDPVENEVWYVLHAAAPPPE